MRGLWCVAGASVLISVPALADDVPARPMTIVSSGRTTTITDLSRAIKDKKADVILDGGTYYLPNGNFEVTAKSIQFRHGARLVIGRGNAVIVVASLISDHGAIISYDKPAASGAPLTGQSGEHGGDGGIVTIVAALVLTSDGVPFQVDVSGQNGGSGARGRAGEQGPPGRPGSPAILQHIPNTSNGPPSGWTCVTPGGDGGNGLPGRSGGDGGLGGAGGNGGVAFIRVALKTRLSHISATANGGVGGAGGAGGAGGPGGTGGAPGNDRSMCASGHKGADGARGMDGVDHSRDKASDGQAGSVDVKAGR